jgi:hypothetical protein
MQEQLTSIATYQVLSTHATTLYGLPIQVLRTPYWPTFTKQGLAPFDKRQPTGLSPALAR